MPVRVTLANYARDATARKISPFVESALDKRLVTLAQAVNVFP